MSDPTTRPISVFLAEDDPGFRSAYARLFARTPGFILAGEADAARDAARMVRALRPDVALLDVQLPDGSGLVAAHDILMSGQRTRVVVLTMFDLDEYVTEALRVGVAGFLLKNAAPAEVIQAVRAAHAGHAALAPEITARLVAQFAPRRQRERHPFADHRLSDRELQVIRLVARGYSNQRIGMELYLSHETIRTYLKRLFARLGVNDRTHLAVLAHEAGLLRESR